MEAKYNKGNLIILNSFGLLLRDDGNQAKIGIVISGPRNYMHSQEVLELFYWVYDVMIGNQLITDVPQEFIDRMVRDEENT
tara:strand:- start:350 stop:592 length:243 start_codon:yes stop_codon:yes gene_type:complete